MKIRTYALMSAVAMAAVLASTIAVRSVTAQAANQRQRVIITFNHEVNQHARAALENIGGQTLRELELVNGIVALIPEQAIPSLSNIDGITAVEPDVRVFALAPPGACTPWPDCKNGGGDGGSSQPAETLEWGVDRIDADLAWNASRGVGQKVAIIDTGIDQDHADLAANIAGGVNFVAPQSGPPWKRVVDPNKWDDDNGHGTHVAGIVAARDNAIGVIGVAPEASVYGVKVLDKNGSGYTSDVISGIDWAVQNNMDVINMSLGSGSDVQALHDAVDAAYNAGIVVVAAAGNSGDGSSATDTVEYPAKYDSVIAVAATDSNDDTPYWSSEGAEVAVAAPGVSIRSTWNDGLYNTISGTSMAAPHAAGTVALLLGTGIPAAYDADSDGAWDPGEVRAALRATADDLSASGFDVFYGHGLIDAEEAVTGSQTNT